MSSKNEEPFLAWNDCLDHVITLGWTHVQRGKRRCFGNQIAMIDTVRAVPAWVGGGRGRGQGAVATSPLPPENPQESCNKAKVPAGTATRLILITATLKFGSISVEFGVPQVRKTII